MSHWQLSSSTWHNVQTICLLHLPFKKPFLNKPKPKKTNMARDCSGGLSDWNLAGHLTLHQGERGPGRAAAGAAQVMQQMKMKMPDVLVGAH